MKIKLIKSSLIIIVCLVSFVTMAQNNSDGILGEWKTEEGNIVSINLEDKIYKGILIYENKDTVDVLRDFKQIDDQYEGVLYAAKRHLTFDAIIKVIDKNTINVIIKKGFLSKTMEWIRM